MTEKQTSEKKSKVFYPQSHFDLFNSWTRTNAVMLKVNQRRKSMKKRKSMRKISVPGGRGKWCWTPGWPCSAPAAS